ncbi:FixH family protein [Arhodomonas sp. SL1]|uniref:FixH family protein n=1 Tax=Arhodomonas sp. SL1 TaxID=3425691 RepID=UPI003F8821EC
MSASTSKPWYREFWCWFVFAPLGLWVIAMVATVVVLSSNSQDLVAGDYGRMGKAYVQGTDQEGEAVRRGIAARLHVDRQGGHVTLVMERGRDLPEALRLALLHPTEERKDLSAELRRDSSGMYRGGFGTAVAGRRYVVLESPDGAWRLRGELRSGGGELHLGAEEGGRGGAEPGRT